MKAIQAFWERYLNEILGLLVMVLMTVALVAGQAQARSPSVAASSGVDKNHHVFEVSLSFDGQNSPDSYAGP